VSTLVFPKDITTKSTLEVNCKSDQTYNYPNPWTKCVDKLPCSRPTIETAVMEYDWTDAVGLIPDFAIKYALKPYVAVKVL
jgi:hypothetical protein